MQIILLIIIRENNVDETPHEQNKKTERKSVEK